MGLGQVMDSVTCGRDGEESPNQVGHNFFQVKAYDYPQRQLLRDLLVP